MWTGNFKNLDAGQEDYILPGTVLDAMGEACEHSGNTIPSAFGSRVPNLSTQRHQFIAETWLLFTTMLGPTVLRQRFLKPEYYVHFVNLVALIDLCLQLSLTEADVDCIEEGFARWVQEFER